jgi:hypothetical protein
LLLDLLNTTDSVAEAAPNMDGQALAYLLVGGGSGGGVAFIFMKGALAQMRGWKDIVQSHENRNAHLEHENGVLTVLVEDQRKTINEAQVQLEVCRRESLIQEKRIEQLSIEQLDMKIALKMLNEQVHGRTTLDEEI